MLNTAALFKIDSYAHAALFSRSQPVWSALRALKNYMDGYRYPDFSRTVPGGAGLLLETIVLHEDRVLPAAECTIAYGDTCKGNLTVSSAGLRLEGASVVMAGAMLIGSRIAIGRGVLIEGGATIKEPAIIGDKSEIRQGAYMRGYCLIGERCVVGHATEVKHSIFLDDAKAGHFAYLGDSILGNKVNLGAGTKFANLRFSPGTIHIPIDEELHDTEMRKFGAILGDEAQTGCNSVTNPGTIIGKKGLLMPNTTASPGYHQDACRIRPPLFRNRQA